MRVAYKENKKPWDDCQACRVGQKAEIGQGLTIFILQGRPQRPVRNSLDHLVGDGEQPVRNLEDERLGGFDVDGKIKLGGQRDRQVGSPPVLEILVDVVRRHQMEFRNV